MREEGCEMRGKWGKNQYLDSVLCSSEHAWTIFGSWQSALSPCKRPQPSRNNISMKGKMVNNNAKDIGICQTRFTWTPGPNVSQKNIAQSITLPLPASLLLIGNRWHQDALKKLQAPSYACYTSKKKKTEKKHVFKSIFSIYKKIWFTVFSDIFFFLSKEVIYSVVL